MDGLLPLDGTAPEGPGPVVDSRCHPDTQPVGAASPFLPDDGFQVVDALHNPDQGLRFHQVEGDSSGDVLPLGDDAFVISLITVAVFRSAFNCDLADVAKKMVASEVCTGCPIERRWPARWVSCSDACSCRTGFVLTEPSVRTGRRVFSGEIRGCLVLYL